jgi:hypothetical protein
MKQLLDQDWASKVLGNLAQLLKPDPPASNTPAATGPVHAVSWVDGQEGRMVLCKAASTAIPLHVEVLHQLLLHSTGTEVWHVVVLWDETCVF